MIKLFILSRFQVHIKFQNAEPLIEKFNQDLFERYELTLDENNTCNKINISRSSRQPPSSGSSKHNSNNNNTNNNNNISKRLSRSISSSSSSTNSQFETNPTTNSNCNYFYYDTVNKGFVDINSLDSSIKSSQPNIMETQMLSTGSKLNFPLSFIDAVNKKQLDLESGLFRDPQTGSFGKLRLNDALQSNLLDAKSAYLCDSHMNRTYDLNEAYRHGLLANTARGTIVLATSTTAGHQSQSLSDALKTGYLKIGKPLVSQQGHTKTSSSVTSETQSMSVRSILDPSSGEFLMPTEAIKRKILDPYKGLFTHPVTGESWPISEAIQKGFVIVEILIDSPNSVKKTISAESNNRDPNTSSIISTSLIRETKSYHLLGVYDPTRNDEISIKEAIGKGILDRQKGLYVHPLTGESFSISDAINKGVIRARILSPVPAATDVSRAPSPPYQSLVSTNRFEENRTYTICGAIDLRSGKKVSLSQAITDGIIDSKNGTFVNLKTNEALSINKAIELNLVLTESGNKQKSATPTPAPVPQRDVRTLNIEFVRDPRTDRNVTVSEAMHIGLLDRQSLNYHNPLTNETLSLNKAYQKGCILGHYSDSYLQSTSSHLHQNQLQQTQSSYFIISVFDPVNNKTLTLDQAVHAGLFDYQRGVYMHPQTGEVISLTDAVRKGLVDAQIFEKTNEDLNLPVAAFGIDKKITSMRTKFNKDGSSMLQIEIESLKPTRGIYELDEIEDFQHGSIKEINGAQTATSTHEYRQVVDINSVHRVKEDQQQRQVIQIVQPVNNVKQERSVVVHQVSRELGLSLDSKRVEKVIDDCGGDERSGIVRINIANAKYRNGHNNEIPERKQVNKPALMETIERKETLIINDVDNRNLNRHINIDGQTHVFKNEVIYHYFNKILKTIRN